MCKDVTILDLNSLLEKNWGFVDGVHEGDRFWFNVEKFGIGLRYLKTHAKFYMRFFYKHWMYKGGKWVPLQVLNNDIVAFDKGKMFLKLWFFDMVILNLDLLCIFA